MYKRTLHSASSSDVKETLSDAEKESIRESEEAEYDAFFNSDDEMIDSEYSLENQSYILLSYEDTVINRLDNILTCSILSTCFLFLLFFYSVKRKK